MKDYESLSHTKWDGKYHVVFIPKYRRKRIFGTLRQHLGEIFREFRFDNVKRTHPDRVKGTHPLVNGL